jgi:phosphate transport system permease protein
MTAKESFSMPSNRGRTINEFLFKAAAYAALLLVLVPAVWIIAGVVYRALPHWHWSVLWTTTTGTDGLENAILGTLVLMLGVLIVAGSIGVLAGIHLAELAKPRKNGKPSGAILRLAVEVLSGFPSIVLGYVAYVALVTHFHWQFGLLPAILVLSVLVVPYIAKSTETSLRQVPTAYREGAAALGFSSGRTLRTITLKSALPGIATGLILALAISAGETAPLIYTAGFSDQNPTFTLLHHPIGYLTYVVWTDYNQPNNRAIDLSYDAALVLIVLVLLLLVVARLVVSRTQRHAEAGASAKRRRRRPAPEATLADAPTS